MTPMLKGAALACLAALSVTGFASANRSAAQDGLNVETATRRAVGYLIVEVPRWRREHPCYSCHNNGDGTRALMVASGRGLLDIQQVNDAANWLRSPDRWALNSQDGGVKDFSLSRIQFTYGLQALTRVGGAGRASFERAAVLVAEDQRPDGSWAISATSNVGTPTGYGTPLATAIALRILRDAGSEAAKAAATRAEGWFRTFEPQAVLEASALILALDRAADPTTSAVRQKALAILAQGQARDGGWGPYTSSPSEPFDTAVAMLALLTLEPEPALAAPAFNETEWRAAVDRGRSYLLAQQSDDGSWPETTRPALQESYSQRISTTAWALTALLAEQ